MSTVTPNTGPGPRRIVMFVKNSFEYDARVRKEADTLLRAGNHVVVVAIHAPGATKRHEFLDGGLEVVRVPRLYGRLGRLAGPSTVAPGAASSRTAGTHSTSTAGNSVDQPAAEALPNRRSKASVFGRLRRFATTIARRGLRLAGPVARAANTWWLDRHMVRAATLRQPQVLHAHDLNTLRPAARAAAQAGAKLVYDAHELHRHRNDMAQIQQQRARWLEQRLIRRVDLFITAGDAWADYLSGLYRLPRPVVLRNVPVEATPEPGWDLRTHLGIRAQDRILLYQGSIQRNRGVEEAINALKHLENCVLVVAGYGAHQPALERIAAHLGLRDRVHFFGPVPNHELLHWTASADIGLCGIRNSSLSYYWSLPNKLFEYVMAGIPVVASDFPEMGSFVRETDVGEVCDPDDPASIAAAVRRIIDHPERRAECRQNANVAAQEHNWTAEERKLLSAYAALTD